MDYKCRLFHSKYKLQTKNRDQAQSVDEMPNNSRRSAGVTQNIKLFLHFFVVLTRHSQIRLKTATDR